MIGLIMIGLLLNGLCCCCATGASMTRTAFAKTIKMSYIGLNLAFAIGLFILSLYGDVIISFFSKFINCPKENDFDLSICLGVSLVVRVSLALVLFHFVIMLLLFTRDSFAKFLNEQCFLLKAGIIAGIVFGLLFVDNNHLRFYV